MSKLSDKIDKFLKESFPHYRVHREYHVDYQNNKLLFDFFLPELKILIEVQGQQHYTFNSFHFKSENEFKQQRYRDMLKTQWCSENNYKLLEIKYDIVDKLDAEKLKLLIINIL